MSENVKKKVTTLVNPFPPIIVGTAGFFLYAFCYRLAWKTVGGAAGIALICVFNVLLSLVALCWTLIIAVGPGHVPKAKYDPEAQADETADNGQIPVVDSFELRVSSNINSKDRYNLPQESSGQDIPLSILKSTSSSNFNPLPRTFICDPKGFALWCPQCLSVKMDRSHHTSQLNRCVPRMDHFCGLINAVIGERNTRWFLQLVFYFWLIVLFTLVCTLVYIHNGPLSRNGVFIALYVLCGAWVTMLTSFISVHISYILRDITTIENKNFKNGIYPIFNIDCNGQRVVTRVLPEDVKSHGPYSQGPWKNWTSIMGPTPFHWLFPFVILPASSYGVSRLGRQPQLNDSLYQTLQKRFLSNQEGYLSYAYQKHAPQNINP